jgi:lysophospholipase L1-like esterase
MTRIIAMTCLALAVAGFVWAYARINKMNSQIGLLTDAVLIQNERLQIRSIMIKSQISQADDPVVFVGDSIVEAALLPQDIDGHRTVNAGIGGTTPQLYLSLIRETGLLNGLNSAHAIILSIGTNSAKETPPFRYFEGNYLALVENLRQKTKNLVLVAVPEIESSRELDPAKIAEINATIKATASRLGLRFVDMPHIKTMDGVHPNAEGYKTWLSRIVSGLTS